MTIRGLRESLEQIRSYVEAGATDKALDKITATLRELDKGRLLTTTEAAELLGIRSVNTLKLLLRLEQVPTVRRGNRRRGIGPFPTICGRFLARTRDLPESRPA